MEYIIDMTGVTSSEELHRRIREALPCPEWYGNNLDAFNDLLTEQGAGWHLTFLHPEEFEEALPLRYATFRRLCANAVEDVPGLTITFA